MCAVDCRRHQIARGLFISSSFAYLSHPIEPLSQRFHDRYFRARFLACSRSNLHLKGIKTMATMTSKVYGGETEDRFTGAIESQTSKIPSSAYLGMAIGSMAASATLKIVGRSDWALFV